MSPPWTTPPHGSALVIITPSAARAAVEGWNVAARQLDVWIPADKGVAVVG